VAPIGGAILGLLVGTIIVAQTLYSSTKDHLNESATLRALGASKGYNHHDSGAPLFLLTFMMCALSALSAIVKVTTIDPAMVFNR
jgi:putative ABC transport system permease protein